MADIDTQTLLDWLRDLLNDPEARQALLENSNYLEQCGWGDLDAADIEDALREISDDDDYDDDDDDHVHYRPPHHYHDDDDADTYLRTYVSNNYSYVDDRDTEIDNSVHQDIDTDGGDFDQTIDNDPVVASGDGAVAAGDDIRDSQVTTGDDNVVGDDNQVSGDDSTTAFGRGDATSADFEDARFGDGSGVSLGGDARGSASDDDTETSVRGGDGDTTVNTADDNSTADQDTTETAIDNSDNSDTDTDIDTDNSVHVDDTSQSDVNV